MTRKLRITFIAMFVVLLLTEILIGLYVDDRFIRPYIGDVLVTVLLCCLVRMIIPEGVPLLPVYIFIFATLVETAQYFQVVTLLGLEDNPLLSTIIGTSFSWIDVVCYAVGCVAFRGIEKALYKVFSLERSN